MLRSDHRALALIDVPRGGMSGPLVSMRGVNKWYGDLHALRDIDLDIAEREVVVVIGPSGSGKSTVYVFVGT